MFLPGGGIGVPLTILQGIASRLHTGTILTFTPAQIGANVLLGSAVYGEDRVNNETSIIDRVTIKSSLVASLSYYSMDAWTLPMVPLIYILHTYYKDLKPIIAPIKPAFVSFFWTIAVYYLPVAQTHDNTLFTDVLTPAFLFLNMAGFSHIADVYDIEEDEINGIMTPAVIMGKDEGIHYGLALVLASVLLHEFSENRVVVDFMYDVTSIAIAASLLNKHIRWASLSVSLCAIIYAIQDSISKIPKIDLILWVLQSTESSHGFAIDVVSWMVRESNAIPDPFRKYVVEFVLSTINLGDNIGHNLLMYYSDLLRSTL